MFLWPLGLDNYPPMSCPLELKANLVLTRVEIGAPDNIQEDFKNALLGPVGNNANLALLVGGV